MKSRRFDQALFSEFLSWVVEGLSYIVRCRLSCSARVFAEAGCIRGTR
jgi:hypothetical protein